MTDLVPLCGSTRAWGTLLPRIGYSTAGSRTVASALLSWRALNILYNPLPPLGFAPHTIILPPLAVDSFTGIPACFQMGYPSKSKWGLAGMNPVHWDVDSVESEGRNVFIYWKTVSCCVEPGKASCGLGVAASNQDNFCAIPYDPLFSIVPGMPPAIPKGASGAVINIPGFSGVGGN